MICFLAAGFGDVDSEWLRNAMIFLAAAAAFALCLKKLFFEKTAKFQPIPLPVDIVKQFATHDELEKLEIDLHQQMKEMRSYVHDIMDAIRKDIQRVATNSDSAREGIHDRLNALVEVTFEMRGLIRGGDERERKRHPDQ